MNTATAARGIRAAIAGVLPAALLLASLLLASLSLPLMAADDGNERLNAALDHIATTLATQEPDAYVGIVVGQRSGDPPKLYIKGEASELVERLVREAGFPIEVMDGQPYSFLELEERSLRVQKALISMGIEESSVGTDITAGGRIPVLIRKTAYTPSEKIIRLSLPADLRDAVEITITAEGGWGPDQSASPDPCAAQAPASPSASAASSLVPSAGPSDPVAPPSPSPDPCASPSPSSSPRVAPTTAWGPMAVVRARPEDEVDAGFGPGRLVIGERCVVLRGDGGSRTTLVWREGQAEWDAERRRIRFRQRDGEWLVLENGDRLTFGGYDAWEDDGPVAPPWIVMPNPGCPKDRNLVNAVRRVP